MSQLPFGDGKQIRKIGQDPNIDDQLQIVNNKEVNARQHAAVSTDPVKFAGNIVVHTQKFTMCYKTMYSNCKLIATLWHA